MLEPINKKVTKRGQTSDWLWPNMRNSNLTQHGAPINNEYDKLILTKMGLLLEWVFYWNGDSTGMWLLLEWAFYWNGASTGMGPLLKWGLHWNGASTGKGISTQTLFQ